MLKPRLQWVSVCFAMCALIWSVPSQGAEDFKGQSETPQFTLGGLAGLGIIDSSAGFALIGTAAQEILANGFIPDDVNDQVYLELELGPVFVSGSTALFYSAHLRWDFQKDDLWTFYAIGGLGGNITGAALGDRWELFPRFGAGAFRKLSQALSLRGEISHELIAAGVSFGF